MYFSKDDLHKIEEYLKTDAKRDTQFELIPKSLLQENDSVAIIHRNRNCRINIRDLIDSIDSAKLTELTELLQSTNLANIEYIEEGDKTYLAFYSSDGTYLKVQIKADVESLTYWDIN